MAFSKLYQLALHNKHKSTKRNNNMKQIIALALFLMCSSLCYAQRNNNNSQASNQQKQTTVSSQKNTARTSNQKTTATQKLATPVRNPQELHTETFSVNGVSFKMCFVKGGEFLMGATPEQESNNANELPVHKVSLQDYYIGQTEVTNSLWNEVMGTSYSGNDLPVHNVSWNDCDNFIVKLNSLTGLIFRLPTEEEWEYAARGGNNSKDYKYSGSNYPEDVAWYKYNSGEQRHNVATKQPNELGIYDMTGNVEEWCNSIWHRSYDDSWTNGNKVYRDCSYKGPVNNISHRWTTESYLKLEGLGFRLALTRIPPHYQEQERERQRKFTEETHGTINGHEWIDLGLSVKWATCNVGANSPSDYGGYFAWGEIRTKSIYSYNTYFDCINADNPLYNSSWKTYKIGGSTIITPTSGHDTARENWGGNWRMPTYSEFKELKEKCKWSWVSLNGHNGYIVKGPNGNSIFLPAAGSTLQGHSSGNEGKYWSSMLESDSNVPKDAFCLSFFASSPSVIYFWRIPGCSVRPVTE